MRIAIYTDDDKRGYVNYNPFTKEVIVQHPIQQTRIKVYRYLTTNQDIGMPIGEHRGQIGIQTILPSDSPQYIEIALCVMYNKISVHVDWSESTYDINNSLDKEVEKSIMEYEILDL